MGVGSCCFSCDSSTLKENKNVSNTHVPKTITANLSCFTFTGPVNLSVMITPEEVRLVMVQCLLLQALRTCAKAGARPDNGRYPPELR